MPLFNPTSSLPEWNLVNQSGQAISGSPTWTYSTPVSSVNIVGLGGASDILVIAYGVAVSVSGAATVQVSTNGGSSYYSTSGDYVAVDAAGTAVNTIGASMWGTNSTAARYGQVILQGCNLSGTPKSMAGATPSTTPLRFFIADLANGIDAIRIVGSGGGNLTAGSLYVYKRD